MANAKDVMNRLKQKVGQTTTVNTTTPSQTTNLTGALNLANQNKQTSGTNVQGALDIANRNKQTPEKATNLQGALNLANKNKQVDGTETPSEPTSSGQQVQNSGVPTVPTLNTSLPEYKSPTYGYTPENVQSTYSDLNKFIQGQGAKYDNMLNQLKGTQVDYQKEYTDLAQQQGLSDIEKQQLENTKNIQAQQQNIQGVAKNFLRPEQANAYTYGSQTSRNAAQMGQNQASFNDALESYVQNASLLSQQREQTISNIDKMMNYRIQEVQDQRNNILQQINLRRDLDSDTKQYYTDLANAKMNSIIQQDQRKSEEAKARYQSQVDAVNFGNQTAQQTYANQVQNAQLQSQLSSAEQQRQLNELNIVKAISDLSSTSGKNYKPTTIELSDGTKKTVAINENDPTDVVDISGQFQSGTPEKETPQVNELGFDPNSESDFKNYLIKGSITASDKERIKREFGDEKEFKKQAKLYSNYIGASSRLPRINDTLYDISVIKKDFENAKGNKFLEGIVLGKIASGMTNEGNLIRKLKGNEVFNYLLNLKRGGATFGALSDTELKRIAEASPGAGISGTSFEGSLRTINMIENSLTRMKNDMLKTNQFAKDFNYSNYDTISSGTSSRTGQQTSGTGQTTSGAGNSVNYGGSTFNFND